MSNDPSEIRAQIEQTRASLSGNVDALAYEANPAHIAERQVAKVKASGSRVLDRIMGSADDLKDAAADKVHGLAEGASGVGDSIASAPDAARRKAQGNPLAAGAVAFGIGLLLAAAFPASEKEQELAREIKDKAQPLTDQVTAAGKQVAENLAGSAKDAVESLKESATEAAQAVQGEGGDALSDVKDTVQNSVSEVAGTAQDAVQDARTQATTAHYQV